MSRLMATQSDPSVENLILQDFRQCIGRELDRAAIFGSGIYNEPVGILNTAGIGSIAMGTDGGIPTWSTIVGVQNAVEAANAVGSSPGWATSVKLKNFLRGTLKNNISGADYLWGDGITPDGRGILAGEKGVASTTVPSNLTKGTGTNLSALIFGDWRSLIVATWGVMSLEINPYQDFRKGTVGMRVMIFADIALRHPQSFAAATDCICQ